MKRKKIQLLAGMVLSVCLSSAVGHAQTLFIEELEETEAPALYLEQDVPEEPSEFFEVPEEPFREPEEALFAEENDPDFSMEELVAMTGTGEAFHLSFPMVLSAGEVRSASAGGDAFYPNAVIDRITVEKTEDGTPVWDSYDGGGGDTGSGNGIVRSFDTVNYTLSYSVGLNTETGFLYFDRADLSFRGVIPNCTMDEVVFDTDAMKWLLDARMYEKDNSVILEGRRHLERGDGQNVIPGAGTLSVVVKALGAADRTEIRPFFDLFTEGGEAAKATVQAMPVQVSAGPRINVHLTEPETVRNNLYCNPLTGELSETKREGFLNGRMQRIGVLLELRNEASDKGIKGLERTEGEIVFRLNAKGFHTSADGSIAEELNPPILWEYGTNTFGKTTGTLGRDATCLGRFAPALSDIPYASFAEKEIAGEARSCFNSGTWNVTQNGTECEVRISDYNFGLSDYESGTYGPSVAMPGDAGYAIGFSSGYLTFFQELPESVEEISNYQVDVSDGGLMAVTVSGQRLPETEGTENQTFREDDSRSVQYEMIPTGYFVKHSVIDLIDTRLSTSGLGTAAKGDLIPVQYFVELLQMEDIHSMDVLVKIDDTCFDFTDAADSVIDRIDDPVKYAKDTVGNFYIWDGNYYQEYTDLDYTVRYAAKPDGKGWSDDLEMQTVREESLLYFDSVRALKESGYTCVGYLVQMRGTIGPDQLSYGKRIPVSLWGGINAKIREDAVSGSIGQFVTDCRGWRELLPTLKSGGNGAVVVPYGAEEAIRGLNGEDTNYPYYKKTEYDESGSIVPGTNNNNSRNGGLSGTCIRIGDTKTSIIRYSALWDSQGEPKTAYDIGSGQNRVLFKVVPSAEGVSDLGCTVTVTDSLPAGLSYVSGSAVFNGTVDGTAILGGSTSWRDTGSEPNVVEKEDGSRVLTWEFHAVSGAELPQILYETKIEPGIENGARLETRSVIRADADRREGSDTLLGRKSTVSVIAVNLNGVSLKKILPFKEEKVDTDTPFSYRVVVSNYDAGIELQNVSLTDELPGVADGRGSEFHGTYSVKTSGEETAGYGIVITAKGFTENSWNVLKVFESEDGISWTEAKRTTRVDNSAVFRFEGTCRVLKITGDLPSGAELTADYTLWPSGNNGGDLYANDAVLVSDTFSGEIRSGIVHTVVEENSTSLEKGVLRIRKTIDLSQVFASHGKPVFQFRVTQLFGDGKEWYVSLAFPDKGEGLRTEEAVISDLVFGMYRVEELTTMRYVCEKPVQETKVGETEAVVSFKNSLTTEEHESDTCLVRNIVNLEGQLIYPKEEE